MFLRNYWYVAGFPDEFGQHLVGRTFLDERVVIFRTQHGEPVALEDRCAHRRLPLSMGTLLNDTIQCRYHGLRYDCTGKCVHIPGHKRSSQRQPAVKKYPILDKYGFTWIWIGDPEAADASKLPDYSVLADPAWEKTRIQFHLNCNYHLIIDNLMDLSHLAYVHNTTTGNDAMSEDARVETVRKKDVVQVRRSLENVPASPTFKKFANYTDRMDGWQISEFSPPSYVRVSYGSDEPGTGMPSEEGYSLQGKWGFRVFHGITPETETTAFQFRYVAYKAEGMSREVIEEFIRECDQIISEDAEIFPIQNKAIMRDLGATLSDINSTITISHDKGLKYSRGITRELLDASGEIAVGGNEVAANRRDQNVS